MIILLNAKLLNLEAKPMQPVGVAGFQPAVSRSRSERFWQAKLHSVIVRHTLKKHRFYLELVSVEQVHVRYNASHVI